MLAKRIIPRIDISDGKCASVIAAPGISDATDPAEAAHYYVSQGADEIYLFDAYPSPSSAKSFIDALKRTSEAIDVPLIAGGAIYSPSDVGALLENGADRAVICSAAVRRPTFISMAARQFSPDRIDVRIETDRTLWGYRVMVGGAGDAPGAKKKLLDTDLVDWALRLQDLGAGEIILNSAHSIKIGGGYDVYATSLISEILDIPVVAEGGEGHRIDFSSILAPGMAMGAISADPLHSGLCSIKELKEQLVMFKIPVRFPGETERTE